VSEQICYNFNQKLQACCTSNTGHNLRHEQGKFLQCVRLNTIRVGARGSVVSRYVSVVINTKNQSPVPYKRPFILSILIFLHNIGLDRYLLCAGLHISCSKTKCATGISYHEIMNYISLYFFKYTAYSKMFDTNVVGFNVVHIFRNIQVSKRNLSLMKSENYIDKIRIKI
jgi:hypothetical protein